MEHGFFRSLFDISFTSFITTKLIKVVYVLNLVLVALGAVAAAVAAFQEDTLLGIGVLLTGALLSLLYLVYLRLVLEFIIQIFRITETLRDQIQLQRAAFSAAGWLPTGAAVTQRLPTPPKCPECGAVPTPGAAFCRNCGHSLV
jgi:Domain of unknown function (DUF4282)